MASSLSLFLKFCLMSLVLCSPNTLSFAARTLGDDSNGTLSHMWDAITYAIPVTYDSKAIIIRGQRKLILSGSIHYPRSTPNMWRDLIQKAKDGGLNTIETYVFWSNHEPQYRQYDFTENNDLVGFIRAIHEVGMYAILRIGPYVCAEWSYGGFPVWLHNIPNIEMRTINEPFQQEMQIFTTKIVNMMKEERLFASEGGPIILAQIENEYGNVMWGYHEAGNQYLDWCANLALNYQTDVPWIMCQQDNAPSPIISTCNGYYCDTWDPHKPNNPKFFTENWAGWFKNWGGPDPHRTAEDLAFSVARFFQYGGVGHNYYMYHGGTNFGRTAGGPYITTSYDYDAPLDEYGNLNQPKWGHLKNLHEAIMSAEEILVNGLRTNEEYGNMVTATMWNYEGKRFCMIGSANWTNDITITFEGTQYTIPAWSVSFLPDCYTETYNTARVNTQTWKMEKRSNKADEGDDGGEPYVLNWTWRDEEILQMEDDGTFKNADFSANELIDQKFFNDTSDYVYYMTSVDIGKNDSLLGENTKLHVHTNGKIVHAFVNGQYVGRGVAEHNEGDFIYEQNIKLVKGINKIVLISTLVGLQNYGVDFDIGRNGIWGPVKLITGDCVTTNISMSKWYYKAGLEGERVKLFDPSFDDGKWKTDGLPSNKAFVWYKAAFDVDPYGIDPVVVDLLGMGKGMVWINGHNIGRHWPSMKAPETGCELDCDYKGAYKAEKCQNNCGKSSQRWYHVPRYYLRNSNNVIILFDELGGSPQNVRFKTVTVGTACANAYDGATVDLSCQGGSTIKEINFASFGQPFGRCQMFEVGPCEAPNTMSMVQQACVGKPSCSLHASELTFGPTQCNRSSKLRLAVEATCT